jgi:basic membrane lipoprotein Med (substrate-binding protein (PBP1-ABC) superfamily)
MFTVRSHIKRTNTLGWAKRLLGRSIVQIFHSAAVVLLLVTCGRAETVAEHGFRTALLTPGPISDQAWNAAAYAGLERVRDSLGARVSHIQTRTPAEFDENFRQYGQDGFDLVIEHGFEFQDAAMRVGPDFPETVFITTGGSSTGPNVAPLSFAFEEPSYLAGMAAAAVSRSGVIGAVGGTELPPVRTSFAAFSAGAKAVNPDVRVLISYVGNWEDAAAGKEQALAQVARGADVIFQNADAAGLGVFQAMREARGRWIIGANADQNGIAPEITLGSVVIDIPHAFLLVAREVKEDRFTSRVIELDYASDVVRWVPNPAVTAIPAPIRARIDSIRAVMVAGRFVMPSEPRP